MSEGARNRAGDLTDADLAAAVDQGLLSADQSARLRQLSAERRAAGRDRSDEEDLRFIRNFHDVFLATGLVILSVGLAVGSGAVLATLETGRPAVWAGAGLGAGAAAILWLLAEFFARRHRLFLPAIVICLGFTGFAAASVGAAYVAAFAPDLGRVTLGGETDAITLFARLGPLVATAATALAAGVFYTRFRLPFSAGLTGLGLALAAATGVYALAPRLAAEGLAGLSLIGGVAVFIAALGFDARDPARATRFSDNAFWLHFAAAPLVLNGVMGLIFGQVFITPLSVGAALTTLLVVAAFAVISLLINRRALLVSGLLSAGVALAVIMHATDLSGAALAAVTLIVLGGVVVLLGAGWRGARRALLFWAPRSGPLARLFPPEPAPAR